VWETAGNRRPEDRTLFLVGHLPFGGDSSCTLGLGRSGMDGIHPLTAGAGPRIRSGAIASEKLDSIPRQRHRDTFAPGGQTHQFHVAFFREDGSTVPYGAPAPTLHARHSGCGRHPGRLASEAACSPCFEGRGHGVQLHAALSSPTAGRSRQQAVLRQAPSSDSRITRSRLVSERCDCRLLEPGYRLSVLDTAQPCRSGPWLLDRAAGLRVVG